MNCLSKPCIVAPHWLIYLFCVGRLPNVRVERLVSVLLCLSEAAALPCCPVPGHQGATVHSCWNAEQNMWPQSVWWWVNDHSDVCDFVHVHSVHELRYFFDLSAVCRLWSPVRILGLRCTLWEAVCAAGPRRSLFRCQGVYTRLLLPEGEFFVSPTLLYSINRCYSILKCALK